MRDQAILAESTVCDPEMIRAVVKLACSVRKKKPTAGWEFERSSGLRACKFCVHQGGARESPIVWSVACVYGSSFSKQLAQGFIEKLTILTEVLRSTPEWVRGAAGSQQEAFGPTLEQRMVQANSSGKAAMISSQVGEVTELMHQNIETLLSRSDDLSALDEKADAMQKAARTLQKGARKAKRFKMMQQAKLGAVAGLAVTAGVAAVTIPIIVAVI